MVKIMSKIKFFELKPNTSQLKELNDLELANIVGGYDKEAESSKEVIQKAMEEAVMRSDLSLNGNLAQKK